MALVMGPGRPQERARWGVATLVAGTAATGLATLVHPVAVVSVIASFVVCGLAVLLRALGRNGVLLGFVISAVFIIGDGLTGSAGDAGPRAAQFLTGGAVAVALMAVAGLADPTGRQEQSRLGRGAFREVLTPPAEVRAYAVVVASTVAATTILYRAVGLEFGYWVPLTALAVLQPDAHASRVRLLQRAFGTAAGVGVVTVAIAASAAPWSLAVAVGLVSFGLFCLREWSYHWFVTLLTPTALLMISTVDPTGDAIVLERLANTAVGLVAALLAIRALRLVGRAPTD